jgi:hypothetical protein
MGRMTTSGRRLPSMIHNLREPSFLHSCRDLIGI